MKNFFKYNSEKLKFAFKICSLIFSILAVIFLIIISINIGKIPEFKFIIYTMLGATLIIPIFILLIAIVEWNSNNRYRRKSFKNKPLDQIGRIGFNHSFLLNEKTKFYFTQETKGAIINGFKILINATKEEKDTIEFKALIKDIKFFNREDLINMEAKLRRQNLIFNTDEIIKKYNSKSIELKSINQIESDLIKFTEYLNIENFKPR